MTKFVFNGVFNRLKPFFFKVIEYEHKNRMFAAFDFSGMAGKFDFV